jgi:hypothetical protein
VPLPFLESKPARLISDVLPSLVVDHSCRPATAPRGAATPRNESAFRSADGGTIFLAGEEDGNPGERREAADEEGTACIDRRADSRCS